MITMTDMDREARKYAEKAMRESAEAAALNRKAMVEVYGSSFTRVFFALLAFVLMLLGISAALRDSQWPWVFMAVIGVPLAIWVFRAVHRQVEIDDEPHRLAR